MGIFGLMAVGTHERIVAKLDAESYGKCKSAADERDKFRDQVRDTCARAEKAERHIKMADNQTSAAMRDRDTLRRQLDEAKAEIAALRPDAEWARARKAKAAAYEANGRVRKPRGAAKQEAESLTTAIRDSIQKGARRSTARFKLNEKGLAASKKAVR